MTETQRVHSRLWHRLLGFYVLPTLTLLASLATLPVIARNVDARTWVAVAVGQAVGSVAILATSVGWNFNGPIQLSGADLATKAQIFGESLTSRISMTVVAAPMAALIAASASPRGTSSTATEFAVSTSLLGLSPVWFCVGEGRASWAAWYDAVPRLAAAFVSAALIVAGAPLVVLPVLLGLTAVSNTYVFARMVHRQYGNIRPGHRLRAVFLRQFPSMLTNLVAGAYSSAAVALVSVSTSTAESAKFTSGARLYGLALYGVTVATQAVLVDTRRGRQTRRHLTVTLGIYAGTGALGFVGIGILGLSVSRLLLTTTFEMEQPDALFFGLSFVFVGLGTWLSQVILLPLGDRAWNLASVCVGAAVGVPSIVGLSRHSGSSGGALGLASSELAVLCVLTVGANLSWRRRAVLDAPIPSRGVPPGGPRGGVRQN